MARDGRAFCHAPLYLHSLGCVLMFLWINYDYFVNGTLRIDIIIILMAMLITKVAVMVYYRLTH